MEIDVPVQPPERPSAGRQSSPSSSATTSSKSVFPCTCGPPLSQQVTPKLKVSKTCAQWQGVEEATIGGAQRSRRFTFRQFETSGFGRTPVVSCSGLKAALVRLRAHRNSRVRVPDLADTEGPVAERNCIGAIPPGGEQREANDQSVTMPRYTEVRELDSVCGVGEPSTEMAKPEQNRAASAEGVERVWSSTVDGWRRNGWKFW